jgi:hypothetical protein
MKMKKKRQKKKKKRKKTKKTKKKQKKKTEEEEEEERRRRRRGRSRRRSRKQEEGRGGRAWPLTSHVLGHRVMLRASCQRERPSTLYFARFRTVHGWRQAVLVVGLSLAGEPRLGPPRDPARFLREKQIYCV